MEKLGILVGGGAGGGVWKSASLALDSNYSSDINFLIDIVKYII